MLAVDCFVAGLLAMTSEVAKLLAMTRGAKDVKLQSVLIP